MLSKYQPIPYKYRQYFNLRQEESSFKAIIL